MQGKGLANPCNMMFLSLLDMIATSSLTFVDCSYREYSEVIVL